MKKIFFILLIIFLTTNNVKSNDRYLYLKNDFSYNIYSVSIDNLNTHNFLKYFNNMDIISVYPKINPIYKDILGDISYQFKSNNLKGELYNFKNFYLNLIKKNSYSDYNYLYINGIGISKVLIYISGDSLYNFLITNNARLINFK